MAESKCHKLKMGHVQFSKATSLPRKQIHFWQLTLSQHQGRNIHPQQWARAKKAARILEATQNLDIPTIQAHLKEATSRYKTARASHSSSRLLFIETFDPKHQDWLLRTEEQRHKGRLAHHITRKLKGGSVSHIQHTHTRNGILETYDCDTKDSIEDALLSANVAKYQQCNGSLFLQSPLLNAFGYIGSPASKEVLNGTFTCPPHTPYYAELLLHHMQRPTTPPSNPTPTTFVSTDDYVSSWTKAKEYTTSGISGIHFGM